MTTARARSIRGVGVLALGLGCAFWLAREAMAAPPARAGAAGERREVLELWDDSDPTDLGCIERLGRTPGEDAARRLLLLAKDPSLADEPRAQLDLVRALDAHVRGPRSEEVILVLLAVLRGELSSPASQGPLTARSRATAAMVLGRSSSPLARNALEILAASRGDVDPRLPGWARESLGRSLPDRAPPSVVSLEALENGTNHERRRLLTLLLRERRARPSNATFEQSLQRERPVWTLRAAALLCADEPALRAPTLSAALAHLGARDANLHASAAWAIAVIEPERALPWLGGGDPLAEFASLRQAHRGVLATKALARLRTLLHAAPAEDPGLALERLSIGLGTLTGERPGPAELWRGLQRSRDSGPWLSALASFSRGSDEVSRGPEFEEVRRWLEHEEPQRRSAVAFGLGSTPSARAAALLERAYADEAEPSVRRALLAALNRQGGRGASRILAEAARIDPDSSCRELSREALAGSPATTPAWLQGAFDIVAVGPDGPQPRLVHWSTLEGRPLILAADPDGFVGVAQLPFPFPSAD